MRNCPIWSSLALLSAMAAPSPATVGMVAVTNLEDTQSPGQEVAVTACFTIPQGCQTAELFVTAKLKPGYWLYSITQPSGGPHRTIIELEQMPTFRLREPFTAIQQPLREKTEWPDWPVLEKHLGCVTWHAVIEFAPGVDLGKLAIKGEVRGQVDTEAFCLMPTAYPFMAVRQSTDTCTTHRMSVHRFMCGLHTAESRPLCGRLGWVVKRSQTNTRQ